MEMELRSKAIDKIYKRRDRIEMPEFQREEVWPPEKKRKLIDSILKGWHLPKFYFRVVGDGTYECVDGQQRLVAIWEFYDDKLSLDEGSARDFGGARYSELPEKVSDMFDDFEIEIEEIEEATEDELEELFLRLQLATPLNTAEKLHAVGSEMRAFAKDLAKSPFFKERIALKDTRYAHFVIVVQWLFVEARGIQPQMRFPQLEDFLRDNRKFSKESDLAKRARATLKYLEQAIPTRNSKLRNRANLLSVLMLASRVVNAGLHKGTAEAFGEFIEKFFSDLALEVERGPRSTDRELLIYQEAISYGSTGGDSISTRLRILVRRLVMSHPEFAPLLGDVLTHQNATSQALRDQVDDISTLLYRLNELYAAKNGEDLFKVTNESIAALKTLGSPVKSSVAYGKLIDALYVLLYEGSGACKRLPQPPAEFAMDVKFLRTGLRHDLDHGPEREVGKKRTRKADVFRKYSGKESVSECAPEDFLATQLRLLASTRAFISDLLPR
jgi:hypothetical protein